jgi:hypothetical protein
VWTGRQCSGTVATTPTTQAELSLREKFLQSLGSVRVEDDGSIQGPQCELLEARTLEISEAEWHEHTVTLSQVFVVIKNIITVMSRELSWRADSLPRHTLQAGENGISNCAAGRALIEPGAASGPDIKEIMEKVENFAIPINILLLTPTNPNGAKWCAIFTPSNTVLPSSGCEAYTSNVTDSLGLPRRSLDQIALTTSQAGMYYLVLTEQGWSTDQTANGKVVVCNHYESDSEIKISNLKETFYRLKNKLLKIDRTLGISLWQTIEKTFEQCGIPELDKWSALTKLSAEITACGLSETERDKRDVSQIVADSPQTVTEGGGTRGKGRRGKEKNRSKRSPFSLLSLGGGSNLESAIPLINSNFEKVRLSLVNLKTAALAEKASEVTNFQNEARLSSQLTLEKLRTYALQIGRISDEYLDKSRMISRESLAVVEKDAERYEDYLSDFETEISRLAEHHTFYCSELTCATPSHTTLAINKEGAILMKRGMTIRGVRSEILSCRADLTAQIPKANLKNRTSATWRDCHALR